MIVTDLVLTSAAALFLVATSGNRLAVSGEPVREYRPPETSADDGEGRGVGKETVSSKAAQGRLYLAAKTGQPLMTLRLYSNPLTKPAWNLLSYQESWGTKGSHKGGRFYKSWASEERSGTSVTASWLS